MIRKQRISKNKEGSEALGDRVLNNMENYEIDESKKDEVKMNIDIKIGDIIEIEDHFISNPDFDDIFYKAEISRLMNINNLEKIEEMIERGSIPADIKQKARSKLNPIAEYQFLGNLELPKSKKIKEMKIYDEKDFLISTDEKFSMLTEFLNEKYKKPVDIQSFNTDTVYSGVRVRKLGDKWKNIEKHGIYGNPNRKFTYFSTDYALALSHANIALLEIDLQKLAEKRKIFYDPESSYIDSEENKTFVVMGGIPREAIKQVYSFKRLLEK